MKIFFLGLIDFNRREEGWKISLFRILFTGCLVTRAIADFSFFEQKEGMFFQPIPLFNILGIEELSINVCQFLVALMVVTSILSNFISIRTFSYLFLAVFYFVYYGQIMSFIRVPPSPYVFHYYNLGFFILTILCLDTSTWNSMGKYWVRNLIKLSIGMAYFGVFYNRIILGGLGWIDAENLRALIAPYIAFYDLNFARKVISLPNSILVLFCIGINFFEATFWLGGLLPRIRWLYVGGGIFLHGSIYATLGLDFLTNFGLAYLVYLPDLVKVPLLSKLRYLFGTRQNLEQKTQK